MSAVSRSTQNDLELLRQQHSRLADALDGYYGGKKEQALNVAVTLRVLVHETQRSKPLLFRLDPSYWRLMIYDKLPSDRRAVSAVRVPIMFEGGGPTRFIRPEFDSRYRQVSMSCWWDDDYQPLGKLWLSKKTIVLTVADKDGGAHVDSTVPDAHAAISEPPILIGAGSGAGEAFLRPNLAFAITAQAGCEMKECLERYFCMKNG